MCGFIYMRKNMACLEREKERKIHQNPTAIFADID
jgi:hypothetical protein